MCSLLLWGITTLWIPLITICYSTFILMFIHLTRFHFVTNFNGFILLESVMLFHAFLNLHVWLILIRALVSNLFDSDLQMLHWLTFWLSQEFLTCKDNSYLIHVWFVTICILSTNFSYTPIRHMHPFNQKQDIAASVCSY